MFLWVYMQTPVSTSSETHDVDDTESSLVTFVGGRSVESTPCTHRAQHEIHLGIQYKNCKNNSAKLFSVLIDMG